MLGRPSMWSQEVRLPSCTPTKRKQTVGLWYTASMLPQVDMTQLSSEADSDVFFILLHFASTIPVKILFETGTGNKKHILNITQLSKDLSPKRCNALLGVHAFTRCDSTSCFKGKGKVNSIKLIQANLSTKTVIISVNRVNFLGEFFYGQKI